MKQRSGFFLLLMLFALCAGAQVDLVLFAGPQSTVTHYTVKEVKQPASSKIGLMAGAGLKVPFENQLYFFPSVYYSLKGYKVTLNDPAFPPTEFAKNNNTTIHTIEVAPMFQVDLSKKPSHLFVRVGIGVDFAFSGREKFDTVSTNGATGPVDRAMVFSFGDYGRFSASGNFHLGYESAQRWSVFGFYNHGFGSMNNADGGPKIFHRIAGISLGWRLKTLR